MPDELLLLVEDVDCPPVLVEVLPDEPPNDEEPLVEDVDMPPVLVLLVPPDPPNEEEPLVLDVPPPVEVEAELVAELPPLVVEPPGFPEV